MKESTHLASSPRELFFTASGQTVPVPTDEEVGAAIRSELAMAIGNDIFGEPIVKAALGNAALAVRNLLLSATAGRTPTTSKDTN